MIYGDVVFDRLLGGTILSTEDLFAHLAAHLQPARLLVCRAATRRVGRLPEEHQLCS